MINILRGSLTKRDMARFAGVETLSKVDESLARLADMGYLRYKKVKGGIYRFTLYPEPVKELQLGNETR